MKPSHAEQVVIKRLDNYKILLQAWNLIALENLCTELGTQSKEKSYDLIIKIIEDVNRKLLTI